MESKIQLKIITWISYFVIILASLFVVRKFYKIEYQLLSLDKKTTQANDPLKQFLCDINVSSVVNSTKRDVVLLFASHFASGLILTIKSLRSTGCRARIVLFGGSSFTSDAEAQHFLSAMHVELVPNCDERKQRPYVPHMLRYEYELEWLIKHENEVDRVFHTDSFDVFFQGDPFSSNVPYDSLKFVVEPHQIRNCGWNYAWFQSCYGESELKNYMHNFIICSGTICGDCSSYISLCRLMIEQSEWLHCYSPSMDQPILNYLVWSGQLSKVGIEYSFTGCNEGFFTVGWCALDQHVDINIHEQAISEKNTVPNYVHQYNRIENLTNFFYQKCGIQNNNK